jgi:hypothetical protein
MSTMTMAARETLNKILNDLRDERLAALLDYAEYLLRKQAQEDAADVNDSYAALKEDESLTWEAVKTEIGARVQD